LALEPDGNWTGLGNGGGVAFEFTGPTIEVCLARAVEGFADAVAAVHPSMVVQHRPIEVRGSTPAGLVLAVLEECLRRAQLGEIAVALGPIELDGEVVRSSLDVVPAASAGVETSLPRLVCWHEVSLDPDVATGAPGGWHGRVVAR
jgi:hypothetical protein